MFGYIYTIHNDGNNNLSFCFSNSVPAENVPYYNYTVLAGGETYSFIVDSSFDYVVFSGNNFTNSTTRYLTREKISSMSGTVEGLVDNVGVSAIWDIFNSSISYIAIVVITVIGMILVKRMLIYISKGKSRI